MTTWVFAELVGAAIRRDPNETELFKTEQAEEGEYAGTDALVREILQNSMDAVDGTQPVRVRLALHSVSDLPAPERLSNYFQRLKSPLAYREIGFSGKGVPDLPNGYLICEDFGTRGLGGDPMLARDPSPNDKARQDFFWFWRNIGRSGKTGDDLGRWGLGKTVYRAASRVGCMIGLTVRSCDQRQLLMGQAVLRIHDYQGKEFAPEGFWCAGCDAHNVPLPIEDEAELSRFRTEWNLTRTGEPGLSVVVPYVASEIKGAKILQAVAAHFFMPILYGNLVVEVIAPDIGEVCLEKHSIEKECKRIVWDGPKRTKRHAPPPIDFARKCIDAGNPVATRLLGEKTLPILDNQSFDDGLLPKLQADFAADKLVGVRVRINLLRRDGHDCEGELFVYLQRGDTADRHDSYYVREGMTITKLNSRASTRGISALVLVDQGPLASLLGDSEGPAHEDWDTSEERPDRVWKVWKGRVKFVRRIVDSLVETLTPPVEAADFDLLSDFFSIEQYRAPRPKHVPGDNGKESGDFDPITPNPRWFRLSPRRGGFTIRPSDELPVPDGATLRVSAAYDIPRGNPLKNWSKFDFEFRSIHCTGRQVTPKIIQGNVIDIRLDGKDFSFSADGFDENRDLFVRVDEMNIDNEQITNELVES